MFDQVLWKAVNRTRCKNRRSETVQSLLSLTQVADFKRFQARETGSWSTLPGPTCCLWEAAPRLSTVFSTIRREPCKRSFALYGSKNWEVFTEFQYGRGAWKGSSAFSLWAFLRSRC